MIITSYTRDIYHLYIQYDFVDIQVTNFLIVSIILSSLDKRLH